MSTITQPRRPETPVAGLYASAPQPLPFAPSIDIRAFALRREEGNLLIYSAGEAEALASAGGIARQYLNHRHEALFPSERIAAPLFCHRSDSDAVAERMSVRATFSRRHTLDDDFEVIPTPGHTPGATAYLWDSGQHRFLFTGDTIYLSGGEWRAAVLASSDRERYLESLELMRELDFDVLVPWAATRGEPYYFPTSRAGARRRIAAIATRLSRGEDG
jgi:hypothetical protein